VISLAGTAVLLSVAGAAAGWAYGTRSADPGWVGRLLAAALVQVPAAWALAGLTVAAFGITSRSAAVGWAALAGFVVLGEVGPLLRFNHWLMDVSPYTHTPKLPGQAWHAAPVLWLLASAAALVAIGVAGFERRDVT
jgi:ABC-2 type transport system permease protein